jgi:GST-like protein
MIDLYGGETPNVFKPMIMLEELGVEYRRLPCDIMKGEQFTPEFLAISPNNKVPAMVDHDPAFGGGPVSVMESGAILLYLAEKHGKFMPADPRRRVAAIEWLFWQMASQGPMVGQAGHFRNYAPEKLPYAIERYSTEAQRIYKVLNTRLAGREYIADEYSIADMACWPWILFRFHHGVDLADYPEVERWFGAMLARPAVHKLFGDYVPPKPLTFTEEERKMLFGNKQP